MHEKRVLLLATSILFLISALVVHFYKRPTTFDIDVEEQFTFGKVDAKVHMIVFTEFACPLCQILHKNTLPVIEENYVSAGKVKITLIPLAFLEDSLAACTLSICILKKAPSHMKSFSNYLFHLSNEDLITYSYRDFVSNYIQTGQTFPAPKILKMLREEDFHNQIDHNLTLARSIYPGDIHVPIVLINGKLIKNPDLKNISKAIDDAL